MKDELKEALEEFKSSYYAEITHTQYELICNYITNLQEEKDDLDDYNRHLHNELKKKDDIINELEKWAKEELEQPNWASCGARCMLDKLKELKEGK